MKDCLLAFDLGSSGLKATAVSAEGAVLGSAGAAYGTALAKGGVAQQSPDDWWRAVCAAAKALREKLPNLPGRVCAIGASGAMSGCLPVDAEGTPLRPAMLNSDSRAAPQRDFVAQAVGAQRLYHVTGNVLNARSSLCKVLWVRDNEPDIYAKTAKFLQSKDWLVARLTGVVDTTDYSDASHGQMIDISKKAYDPALLATLGLDAGKLPALRRSHDVVGGLTARAARELGLPAGIPVVAGGGDGACAGAGAGVVAPGAAYCCLGTTAWITRFSQAPVLDDRRRVFSIMALDGEGCGVFGTMQAAGHAFDWACGLLGEADFASANRLAEAAAPGSDGLVFLPYLEGERSPIFDEDARGVYFGLGSMHGRAHLLRATLEGVAYALRSILEVHRATAPVEAMRIVGGGASSALWRQIISDVCAAELQTISVDGRDATSVGAAMAAGVGAGVYRDYADATRAIRVTGRQAPTRRAGYETGYALFARLYPALRPLFALRAQNH